MTNEERCKCTYNETGCSDCEWTRLIQENTKLKAEVEELKEDSKIIAKELVTQIREFERLKSELEQSVIKCTHGYDKRQNEIGETLIYCEYTDNWMNVTLGDCLGNCEAEQSLKGQVSE